MIGMNVPPADRAASDPCPGRFSRKTTAIEESAAFNFSVPRLLDKVPPPKGFSGAGIGSGERVRFWRWCGTPRADKCPHGSIRGNVPNRTEISKPKLSVKIQTNSQITAKSMPAGQSKNSARIGIVSIIDNCGRLQQNHLP